MRPGFPLFLAIIFTLILLIDLYTFRGVRILTGSFHSWWKMIIHITYWAVPVVILVLSVIISFRFRETMTTKSYRVFYFMTGLLISVYLPKILFITFQLSNDVIKGVGLALATFANQSEFLSDTGNTLVKTRALTNIGFYVSSLLFLTIIHGIIWGRFNYKVQEITLEFENLPPAFEDIKVLQISDWHIGSFIGKEQQIKRSIELINSQNADIVLFTGDMVNNVAQEMEPFVDLLKDIKAPLGCFSILGNHDYGEYVSWENEKMHTDNMLKLFSLEKEAGFHLLRNESVILTKASDSIGLAGVENWGLPPFPQYGELNKAMSGINYLPFRILMSHDPSHWDAEILPNSKADLTLSGHTHAMQFGINFKGFKWSPVKWRYPRWAGLYEKDKRFLYVNVGIGYLAFPGRVGFLPEITVFKLKRKL